MTIRLRIFFFLMLFTSAASLSRAQAPPTQSAQSLATLPGLIAMCEDSDGCSNWIFTGDKGVGAWTDGATADLTITHLDAGSITLHRVDTKGTGNGLVADYTGTISSFWIEGDVAWTWPGHAAGVNHVRWHGLLFPPRAVTVNSAKIYETALSRAHGWTVCQDFGEKCSVANPPTNSMMVINGKVGIMGLDEPRSEQIVMFVDELAGGNVTIRRLDTAGTYLGGTVLYTGRMAAGKMEGTFKTIWPGHMNVPMAGKWVATPAAMQCTPAMNIQTAKITARLANLHEDKAAALNCFVVAANQGDSDAQETAGEYYYVGWSGAPDYKKSLGWLQKSAAQNNNDALVALAIYYKQGRAEPANLLLANYYANRAELRKQVQGLLQTVENGSGHGSGAMLDMIGNIGAYFFFGQGEKDEELGATVGHEEAVLTYMNQGMSRVDAEEKVFQEDEAEKAKEEIENGSPCDRGSDSTHDYQLTGQQREEAYLKHSECIERQRESDAQPRDYLRCVETYKESNAIEEHCKYFP